MPPIEDLFDDASPVAELSAQEQTDSKIGVATTIQRIRKTIGFFIIIFSPFGFVILGKGHQGLFYPIPFSYSCLIRDKGQIRRLCGSIQKYS